VAAAGREGLERQIEARRALERSAAASAAAIEAAERRLRASAAAIGLDPDADAEQLMTGLRDWQRTRAQELRRDETAIAEWHRLGSLLDGASLEALADRAAADAARAAELAERLGEPVTADAEALSALEAAEARAREALMAEAGRCDSLRGNLEARREALPDVAEAEESLLAARAELRRVEGLAETLDRTIALLRSAEELVHRSLAPVLAASIGRWLPIVCRGAYVDVSVDPANLAVRVKEAASGQWREARLLSEGTREQIYLLLRVAMAEHLVVNGETAPLLLDEVTVQSDAARKAELLDVLHRISADRQVVLFTHDDDVLAWAGRRLVSERDATVVLPAREEREAATLQPLPVEPSTVVVPAAGLKGR
jgi:DNA repair exonuclease SbcCD ATPase subunit